MSISTATPDRAAGPVLLKQSLREPHPLVTLSAANGPTDAPDLTIHRVTATHHGRTLLMLGHAAEYLVDSHRFVQQGTANDSDNEAVHILMGLSRSVFDEYAKGASKGRRMDRLVLGFVTRLLN
jgi:hypothetical protein